MPSIKIQCPNSNTPFGVIFYPGLNVDVLLPEFGYQTFEFILDSGADCTVVPLLMASLAGVDLPKEPDAYMTGIEGTTMPCYRGKLNMRIQNEQFEVRCLFTQSNNTTPLLGRIDFFKIFQILFDGDDCSISLTKR